MKVKFVYYHDAFGSAASTPETRSTSQIAPGPGPGSYNETVESWFNFEVWSVAAAARTTTGSLYCDICDQTRVVYTSIDPGAEHYGGYVFTIFGNGPGGIKHTQWTKPFIISEGYNLYDIAEELRKCNNPNNNIEDFFNKIGQAYTGVFNFQAQLLNAGYDIIYIDNARGTDDIVRNAHFFEAVVRLVNQNKVGGTATGAKNVVIGQSMGGLVSRYGLAEMAKRPYDDPHTRLLILHDSPQRGANNPVGVQSLTRSFDVPFLFGNSMADLIGQIRATVRVIDQPASQQLSILNAFNGRGDIRSNTFIPNTYQPMITFSGPAPYDVVAVSNGSQCGRGQNAPVGVALAESSLAMLLPAPFFPVPLTSALAGVTGEFASYGLPAYGQQATVSRVDLRLEYRINIGYCPFCVSIPIRFRLLRESATSPPNVLPLETLPGGSANPRQQAGDCADGFDLGSLHGVYAAYFRTTIYNGDICFVPSYSALDVPTVTPATAFAKYINNATDNPSTPNVLHYIAQENGSSSGNRFNVPHITFTPRNSEWIFNEMQQVVNTRGCDTECAITDSRPIIGPVTICGTSTFTSPVQNQGYTYTWTAIPANLFTVASGTGPTFQTSNAANGGGVIQLAISSGGCTPTNIFKDVAVGAPGSPATAGPDWGNDCGRINRVCRIDNFDPLATYAISVTGALNLVGLGVTSTGTYTVASGPIGGQLGHIEITATNACGTSDVSALDVYTPCGDAGRRTASTATLYPNPAKETVDVHVEQADATHPVTVRLFDGYGQSRAEQTSTGATSVRLATDNLPAGLYFVHILRGQQVLSRQQLRIEK